MPKQSRNARGASLSVLLQLATVALLLAPDVASAASCDSTYQACKRQRQAMGRDLTICEDRFANCKASGVWTNGRGENRFLEKKN